MVDAEETRTTTIADPFSTMIIPYISVFICIPNEERECQTYSSHVSLNVTVIKKWIRRNMQLNLYSWCYYYCYCCFVILQPLKAVSNRVFINRNVCFIIILPFSRFSAMSQVLLLFSRKTNLILRKWSSKWMRKFDVNSTGNSQYSNLLVGEVCVPDSCVIIVRQQSLNRAKYEKKPFLPLLFFVTTKAAICKKM